MDTRDKTRELFEKTDVPADTPVDPWPGSDEEPTRDLGLEAPVTVGDEQVRSV